MNSQDLKHYATLLKSFQVLKADAVRMRRQLESSFKNGDLEGLADVNVVVSQCRKIANELRKDYNAIVGVCEKLICMLWVREASGEPVRTEYATITPDVKVVPKVPSKKQDPEEYDRFMRELGVPERIIDFGVVRPHWNSLVEYCTHLAASGEPMPEGHDGKTFNVFKTIVRRKRPLVDDDVDVNMFDRELQEVLDELETNEDTYEQDDETPF